MSPALTVRGLRVVLREGGAEIVSVPALDLAPGEVLGVVGESGCGKSTLALALLWHAAPGLAIAEGDVALAGISLRGLSRSALRDIRGRRISYVPQDPGRALNPALRIGAQVADMLRVHGGRLTPRELTERVAETIREVDLPADGDFLARFPHQLSGGQQQRAALAVAFACRPDVVVLDEPTTGLDVRTQDRVLATVRAMCAGTGVAALYVTHDVAVAAGQAHRVAVMYAGAVVELGPTGALLTRRLHPYTRRLLDAVPDASGRNLPQGIAGRAPPPGERPQGCRFWPRCDVADAACRAVPPQTEVAADHIVACVRPGAAPPAALARPDDALRIGAGPALEVAALDARHGRTQVLHGVSLRVPVGACVAVVGESGSGKTTLARCIAGLHAPSAGRIAVGGEALGALGRERPLSMRRAVQYVFQNPAAALNPRRSVGENLRQWLDVLGRPGRETPARRMEAAMERVGLSADMLGRYADELSGGQLQRVAIARALLCRPTFLICDEITSALDVSVQAAIVALLRELQARDGLGLLFVTHNLPLVRAIADTVVVLRSGRVVEAGPTEEIFAAAADETTRNLLDRAPRLPAFAEPQSEQTA